ncbi:MAG: undecaprenyl-diphosphate phosphatase [Alphaproteobacteria bacterium]|nr:undecaprenyl-diphosphate phosphatase [Alphaproteobacteria bacterium]
MDFSGAFVPTVISFLEFFPVSSSGHFHFFQYCHQKTSALPDEMLHFTHLVPLLILLVAFSFVWFRAIKDLPASVKSRAPVGHLKLLFFIGVSVIPLVILGGFLHFFRWELGSFGLHPLRAIGASFMLFGALFLCADRWSAERKKWQQVTLLDCILLGVIQLAALMPGASRLGLVMMGARLLQYDRKSSLILGLLTGVMVLLGSQVLHAPTCWDYYMSMPYQMWAFLALGSCVGMGCMFLLTKGHGFMALGLYRIILGALMLLLV